MSRPVGVAGDQWRAIVERIEHIEEEIKELTEGKKEIYLEAKGNGFDDKILREVIRVRKQDQKEHDEQESLLDVYLQGPFNSEVQHAGSWRWRKPREVSDSRVSFWGAS